MMAQDDVRAHALALANRMWGPVDQKQVPLIPMSTPLGRRWHLVRSRSHHEERADEAITALGFETFMPIETKEVRHARRRVVVERPLFGRTFFVRFDQEADNWPAIHRMHWVDCVLMTPYGLMRVPDGAIAALKQAVSLGAFDFTRKDAFLPGTKVIVNDGPFSGFVGEVVRAQTRKERAEILLTMLGQVCRVKIEALHLEPA